MKNHEIASDNESTVDKGYNPVVFLDKTVNKKDQDILGSYYDARVISKAIDEDANMIAITSPFGAGKSTVIDLLSEYRGDKKDKEQIVKVSMWSQIYDTERVYSSEKNNTDTNESIDRKEMHKNLLYQIISQIDPSKGTYIIRKLSNNYGIFKIQIKDQHKKFLPIISFFIIVLLWINSNLYSVLPEIINNTGVILLSSIIAVGLLIYTVISSEILFSNHKTTPSRDISINELIDIFKTDVLKVNSKKEDTQKRIIVAIEDLDRTEPENTAVIRDFLVQLRRFYIDSSTTNNDNARRIVFIVSLKKESDILSDGNSETLYEKIFDYIYDLNVVNYLDYDHVLEQLLLQKRNELQNLGLIVRDDNINDIDGLGWITAGTNLSMRLVKDRLNRSLSKYTVLLNRFGREKAISYRKCAVYAYVSTTYEKEFCSTDETLMENLVNNYIIDGLAEATISDIVSKNEEDLEKYIRELATLIRSGNIGDDYRLYFYNYPEKAKVLDRDEIIVQSALLHGRIHEDLEKSVDAVKENSSDIVIASFEKLKKLGQILPDIIFSNEILYVSALHDFPYKVYEWMESLEYSEEGQDKTINNIITLLSLDKSRDAYTEDIASNYCNIWIENFKSKGLLLLRNAICSNFGYEIMWYKALFEGTTPVITKNEMDMLPIQEAVNLINIDSSGFDTTYPEYINKRITKDEVHAENLDMFIDFYESAHTKLTTADDNSIELLAIEFLSLIGKDVDALIDNVLSWNSCIKKWNEKEQITEAISNDYNEILEKFAEYIINIVPEDITANTLEWIDSIMQCGSVNEQISFAPEIADRLYKHCYSLSAIYVFLQSNEYVPFRQSWVNECVIREIKTIKDSKYYFRKLREDLLLEKPNTIKKYKLLFADDCPIITKNELYYAEKVGMSDNAILDIVAIEQVNTENKDYIAEFFNRKQQNGRFALKYLKFIASLEPSIGKEIFEVVDFKNVPYYQIGLSSRSKLRNYLSSALELGTIDNDLHYMERTGTLDEDIEATLIDRINDNDEIRNRYFDLLNHAYGDTITKNTYKVIRAAGIYKPLRKEIRDKLFDNEIYNWYVASGVLYEKLFVYETDKKEVLWDTYESLFISEKVSTIATYMQQNKDFMTDIMLDKAYFQVKNREDAVRMRFTNTLQTKECLVDLNKRYSERFIEEYLSQIYGFVDRDAALYFIDMVERSPYLLASNKVFKNTYEKLVDGVLKRKYTSIRRQAGHGGGYDFLKSLFS